MKWAHDHRDRLLRAWSWASVRHTITLNHFKEGDPQNLDIEPKALTHQVFSIKRHLLRNRQLVPTIDLCPAGQARHQGVHPLLCAQCNQVLLIEQRWARAYKAHVPRQNAPQLRQLVQAALAQERPDGCQVRPGISQQMRGHRRRANPHAAELRHFEDHIVSANAVRPIQGGPFGSQADGNRH